MICFETHNCFPKIENLSGMKSAVELGNNIFLSVKVKIALSEGELKLTLKFPYATLPATENSRGYDLQVISCILYRNRYLESILSNLISFFPIV